MAYAAAESPGSTAVARRSALPSFAVLADEVIGRHSNGTTIVSNRFAQVAHRLLPS